MVWLIDCQDYVKMEVVCLFVIQSGVLVQQNAEQRPLNRHRILILKYKLYPLSARTGE